MALTNPTKKSPISRRKINSSGKKAQKTKKIKKTKKDKKSRIVLYKTTHNPIISPKSDSGWESWQTFNPAAILLDDKVHFLYRAIGKDAVSRFGYANSKDGFKIRERFADPVYEHPTVSGEYACYSVASGGSWGGCEDPRMVRVGKEDRIYTIYTACDNGLRIGLSSIKIDDFLNKRWKWSTPKLISPPNEVHKNWVIFPEKINSRYAILHSISPEILIDYVDSLDFKKGQYINSYHHPGKPSNKWDSYIRGPGPTPIKTEQGWLVFYHAMDHKSMREYKIGAMLLDLKNPTRIMHRCNEPVLVPEEVYEMDGFKSGVVYTNGAVVKDGTLIVYYGSADSCVCAAYAELNKFLKSLIKDTREPVKLRVLKK